MTKLKKRYWVILVYSLICILGYLLLGQILKHTTQDFVASNGAVIGILGAAWTILFGIELYLLLILILAFIGLLVSKHLKKTEYFIGFKFQTLFLLILWLGLSLYWLLIRGS
jgi:hypothetical protein